MKAWQAIVWKELREVGVWMLVGPLLMGGLIWWMAWGNHGLAQMGLLDDGLMVLGSAILAALLGFLQFFFESREDARAFLVHRPMGRSQLFWLKITVGLTVYTVATAVPFALETWWMSSPERSWKLFSWAMTVPGWMDLATGLVYYFAGALVAIRGARWYGSRLLPLGMAIACSIWVIGMPLAWLGMLSLVLGLTILLTGAWGNFVSDGTYATTPRWGRAAVVLSVIPGIGLLMTIVVILVGNAWDAVRRDEPAPHVPYSYWYYAISPDGEVFRSQSTDQGTLDWSMDGQPLHRATTKPLANSQNEDNTRMPMSNLAVSSRYSRTWWAGYYRTLNSYFRTMKNGNNRNREWYYSVDDGVLIEFDVAARQRIGAMGPQEFVEGSGLPRERFPRDPTDQLVVAGNRVLCLRSALYEWDPEAMQLHKLFAAAPGDQIRAVVDRDNRPEIVENVAIRTDKEILVLDHAGNVRMRTPALHEGEDLDSIGQVRGKDQWVVWYKTFSHDRQWRNQLSWVGADGKVMREEELPVLPLSATAARQSHAEELFPMPLIPVVGVAVGMVAHRIETAGFDDSLFADEPLWFLWARGGIITVMGIGCAVALWVVAKRQGWGRRSRVGWAVLGFLLGVGGVLTFFAVQELVVRRRCGGCGKMRVINKDMCEYCGARWETPKLKGVEVFEPVAA